MVYKKRILSITLAFIMIIGSFALTVVADEPVTDDIAESFVSEKLEESPYSYATEVLSTLGIIDDITEIETNSGAFITRAEMCAITLRLIGLGSVSKGIPSAGFNDIADDYWAKDYINMAESLDIIHGDENGNFEPEENITVEQATKIIVHALGYEPKAAERGGYPIGYLSVATDLDLFDGVNISGDYTAPVTREQVIMLVYNALDADLMDMKVYGDGSYSAVLENVSAMEKYHKVKKKKGVVVATHKVSFNNELLESGEVKVGDTTYLTGLDMSDYIGYNVDFYCRTEDESAKSEIILFFPTQSKTKAYEINFDDVESVSVSEAFSVEVKYYEDGKGKLKSVELENPIVMYNNKTESFENSTEMQEFIDENTKQGSFRMLKNKNSGFQDVLFIDNYEAYVVAAVNEERGIVSYFSYKVGNSDTLALNLPKADETIKIFIYDENDNDISLSDLEKNDVIMVYESTDKSLYRIYQSKKQVVGAPKSRKLISKAEETPEEPTPQPEWKDLTIIDFATYKTTSKPTWRGTTPYVGTVTTSNGSSYSVNYPYSYARVGANTNFKAISSLNAEFTDVPDVANTNVFQIDRTAVGGSNDKKYPSPSVSLTIGGSFGDISAGDRIRVTAYLRTKDISVFNSQTIAPTPFGEQADATSIVNMTLNDESDALIAEITSDSFPNLSWSTITCEYTATEEQILSKISINSSNEKYAQTTYLSGIKIEKFVYPEGWTPPPVRPEIPIDNSEYEFFIENEWYKAAANFPIGLLEIGKEITVLLDRNNKIAGYIRGLDKSGYGLLIDVGLESGPFNDSLEIMMLDADNTLNIYETLEEIKAYDGNKITKVPVEQLLTDEPADPMTSHYLWSTNNALNFQAVNRSWLTESDKSKIASRKIVYYETNKEGKIHTILVPSTPEDLEGAKICMVRNFEANKGSEGYIYHVASGKFFAAYSTKDRNEYFYPYDPNALMYVVMAMNYDKTDYSASTASGLYSSQRIGYKSFYNGQLYRKPGSSTIDFMVLNPYGPYNKLEQVAIVDYVEETLDGYYLHGWIPTDKAGNVTNDFKKKIKKDLRILENIWVTDLDKNVGVTLSWDNIDDYIGLKPSLVSYESDYMGNQQTPYVSHESLHRGDVVGIIEENGEIIYLDIKQRVDNGLCVDTDFMHEGSISTMLNPNNGYIYGEITDVNQTLGVFEVTGYYWAGQDNVISKAETTGPSPYTSGAIKKIKMSVLPGRQISVLDMERGSYRTATFRDYKVGDHFYGRGRPDNLKLGIVFENGNW